MSRGFGADRRVLVLGVLLLAAGLSRAEPVIFVDAEAAGGANNGASWCAAFVDLQDALRTADAAGGGVIEIRVAQGVYQPDLGFDHTPGDREASFDLMNGVALRGGFAGCGAVDPDARDVALYETVLSGDLAGDDDTTLASKAENSFHVVSANDVDRTAVLDGFTVTAGNADGAHPHFSGGGMYNVVSDPTVVDCTFAQNAASYGGGIYNLTSSPAIVGCVFLGNMTTHGGGMCNLLSSVPVVTRCTFIGNSASYGGAVYLDTGSPAFHDCDFRGNQAIQGGAVFNDHADPMFTGCLYVGNTSSTSGGGLFNYRDAGAEFLDCTFAANIAPKGTAVACDSWRQLFPGSLTVTNSVLWDGGNEIWNNDGSLVAVSFSDVQGGWPGNGNIDADPRFLDVDGEDDILGNADDNARFAPGSPAIDAGDNTRVPADLADQDGDGDTNERLPLDLDGNPRYIDSLAVSDSGSGLSPLVDLGAYEYQAVCDEDANCTDGVFCNGAELCIDGDCQPNVPVDCDDGFSCTSDTCDEENDVCVHIPDDGLCDNHLYCDGIEVCDTHAGCVDGEDPDCGDGISCTVDTCQEDTDTCRHVPDDTLCDNGLFCDGVESCDVERDCIGGVSVNCDDGVDCTVDVCDEENDACSYAPDDDSCDNGLFCDGSEVCDALAGCIDGADPDCDDGNPYTEDSCDEDADVCVHTEVCLLFDMNGDGYLSVVGDVEPFFRVVYFREYDWYEHEYPGRDPLCAGDCNCDGTLSVSGDTPCFTDCVYFGECMDCRIEP